MTYHRATCDCGWQATDEDYIAVKTEGINHVWVANRLGESGHTVRYTEIEEAGP